MESHETLMTVLVYLSIFGVVLSSTPDPETFLQEKENYATTIVAQAQLNYANTCYLVNSFQPAGSCSRRECNPILDEKGVACVPVANNSACVTQSNPECNWVRANLEVGYVRVPPLNLSFEGDIGSFLYSTISAQQNLDPTFRDLQKEVANEPGSGYFYNLYFGDVQGAFRFYPGREVLTSECDRYDPRKRPWYIGAISIVKDLVVLIDTGSFMSKAIQGITNGNSTTPLEGAIAIAEGLLYTLTNNDRVTIIPFNEKSSPKVTNPPSYLVNVNGLQDPATSDPDFKSLLDKLNTADFSSSESPLPSNYTTAFAQAVSVFNSPGATTDSLKIVILLTYMGNAALSSDVVNLASTAFGNRSQTEPRLFVYELGDNHTSFNAHEWSGITNQVGGYNEQLNAVDVITNPLASLHAFFSFMARSRRDYYGGTNVHFWQPRYTDASSLGNVMSASLPALSPEGDLIGVGGVDVQTDGLSSDLQSGIIRAILDDSSKHTTSPIGANGSSFSNNYGGFYKYADIWNPCNGASLGDSVFCTEDDFASDYLSLTCCGSCAPTAKRNSDGKWIAVGVVGAVFIVLLVTIFFIAKKCWIVPVTPSLLEGADTVHFFLYEELRQATDNFHESRIIGRGTFGVVYRGTLKGENVAVKMLLRQPGDRASDFRAEIKTARITPHPNVVELKGICSHSPDALASQFFLVYELVEGGDLQSWLLPEERGNVMVRRTRFLTWPQRKKIARGAARGLNYLHCGLLSSKKIFHLDIKPQNILIDRQCNPKIADFGISQLYEPGHTYRVVTVRAATFGYCAPEVLDGPQPNSKLDVYSFGMVLLQLVSGRRVNDPDLPKPNLLPWAREQREEGHAVRVIDDRMIQEVAEDCRATVMDHCLQLIYLALRCLSVDPRARPEMSEVVDIINSLCTEDQYELDSIYLDTVDLTTINSDSSSSVHSGDNYPPGGLLKTMSRNLSSSLAKLSSGNLYSPRSGSLITELADRQEDGNRSSGSGDSLQTSGQYHTATDLLNLEREKAFLGKGRSSIDKK